MAWPVPVLFYDVLKGYSAQHTDHMEQSQRGLQFVTASNVLGDPAGEIVTRPGFGRGRATAITGTPAITGMQHYGDVVDEFVLWTSDGGAYRDNANPPGAIAGGTAFTTGNTVLVRSDIGGAAGSEVGVFVSTSRNVPQQITRAMVRTDLAGTPPRGVDFKVWGRRPWMFSPSDGTNTYGSWASFGSTNDSLTAWTTPFTTNFLNFGRPGADDFVLGGEIYLDHLWAFTPNHLYRIYQTPNATLPFAFQDPIFSERGGGPPNIHAVVKGHGAMYWISKNFDVKEMRGDRVRSIGYPVQPFLRGLNDSRRTSTIGGWEPQYRMAVWAVSDGTDATNLTVLALQVDTGAFYLHTISRNAFANRVVSGELRLVGGAYAGFFNNEYDTSTTGNLDDSAAVIDADLQTPRLHLGLPGTLKKVGFCAIEFDPIGTEVLTVQHRLDDETTWTSFAESTYTMAGTDVRTGYFTIPATFRRIQLRVRDNNSGERFRVTKFGFPRPQVIQTSR